MKTHRLVSLHAVFLLVLGCHAKVQDPSNEARLESGCEAWCEVAVPCSTYFAAMNHGDFTTQAECETWCTSEIEEVTTWAPECFDIMLDDRECAAALSCEDFKHYENWNFDQTSEFPFECYEESLAISKQCNG